jgi:hypothetical protein
MESLASWSLGCEIFSLLDGKNSQVTTFLLCSKKGKTTIQVVGMSLLFTTWHVLFNDSLFQTIHVTQKNRSNNSKFKKWLELYLSR